MTIIISATPNAFNVQGPDGMKWMHPLPNIQDGSKWIVGYCLGWHVQCCQLDQTRCIASWNHRCSYRLGAWMNKDWSMLEERKASTSHLHNHKQQTRNQINRRWNNEQRTHEVRQIGRHRTRCSATTNMNPAIFPCPNTNANNQNQTRAWTLSSPNTNSNIPSLESATPNGMMNFDLSRNFQIK